MTIHATHQMTVPHNFARDAEDGEEVCAQCNVCTCHDGLGRLTRPCPDYRPGWREKVLDAVLRAAKRLERATRPRR